jgi:hypothetical protein
VRPQLVETLAEQARPVLEHGVRAEHRLGAVADIGEARRRALDIFRGAHGTILAADAHQ